MRIRIPLLLSQHIPTSLTNTISEPLAIPPPRVRPEAVLSISYDGLLMRSIDLRALYYIASLKYESVEVEDHPLATEDSPQKKYLAPLLEFWNSILFYQNNPFEEPLPIFTFWRDELLGLPLFRLGFCSDPDFPDDKEECCILLTLFVAPGMLDWEKFKKPSHHVKLGDSHYNLLGHLYMKMRRVGCSYALITNEHQALVVVGDKRLNLQIYIIDVSFRPLRQLICTFLMSLGAANDIRLDWSGMPYLGACPQNPTVNVESCQSYRDFDIFSMQRTPAIWKGFTQWKEEVMQAPLLNCGASFDITSIHLFERGILHPWRSPYPIFPIPEETDSIIRRSPRLRNAVVDAILASHDVTFTVTKLARVGRKLFSQVVYGEVCSRSIEETASVCLKLFDERYFPHSRAPNYKEDSDVTKNLLDLNCADDMVCREEGAYIRLSKYQGTMIPHFYGAHVFTMPSGWRCYGVLLEIVEGSSFRQLHPREWCIEDKADFTIWFRHAFRVLAFSGIQQGDWHFSQILCPPSPSTARHHDYVLIDFAFAPQYLGDTFGTPPFRNMGDSEGELAFDMGFGIDFVERYWFEQSFEEQ